MRQGHSSYTKYKEGIVSMCFGFWFKRLPEPKKFVSIDMNCGSGRNGNTRGTPILVANAAKRHKVSLETFFIDKSPSAMRELQRQPEFAQGHLFESSITTRFVRKNNAVALPEIESKLNGFKHGAVICDPNGTSGKAFPVSIVADFLAKRRSFHLVVHLAGIERVAGDARRNPEHRARYDENGTVYSLRDLAQRIPIPLQLVHRHADGTGNPHFIGVFSRQWIPPHADAKLFRVDSHEGREILRRYESA